MGAGAATMRADMPTMRVGDYEVLRANEDELGIGSFGIVWRGRHVLTGKTVAVKRVELDESTRDAREYVDKYVMNEVRLLRSIKHDNIVKLFHSKKMPGYLYMFLEICDERSLDKFVKKHELSEIHKVSFMRDMSRALECLHSQSPVIVHRDLKPENLLISSSSSTLAGFVLKLTDFGISRRAPPGSAAFTATQCGSPPWTAPEIRPGPDGYARYHIPADVFSAGLICHSLIEHVNGEPLCPLKVGVLNVGEWMSIQKLANLPVTIPVITKASDDALKTTIKGIILQMVHPEPQARCSIQQVLSTINMAYGSVATSSQEVSAKSTRGATSARSTAAEHTVSVDEGVTEASTGRARTQALVERFEAASLESQGSVATSPQGVPGEGEATSTRRATAAGRAAAKQSVSADEGATAASRGPAHTQSLVERFGAASLESQGTLCVRKLSHISLTVKDIANLFFGPTSFIVGYKNHPDFFYYKFYSGKFHLAAQKPIPDDVTYNMYKQVSGQGDIYIDHKQTYEVCQLNEEMQLIRTFPSPGVMIGLLPGGKDAVVSNHASPRTEREGVSLSVAPVTNMHAPHYRLDNPDAGAYSREDVLYACGRQNGRIAVIAWNEPWVDIFNEAGRHVCRTGLPRGACKPGCSDTRVLVPLWNEPRICVLSWAGKLMHILEPEQLDLGSEDWGGAVSPVHEGHFSFVTASHEKKVHTYQILE